MEKTEFRTKSIVKIGKNKVEVKPYISVSEAESICDICKQRYLDDGHRSFALIRNLFDMLVAHYCTNIAISGIKSTKTEDDLQVSVDLTSKEVDEFEEMGVISNIAPLISNYDECYADVVETIKNESVAGAIREISNAFPNVDDITKTLKESLASFAELKDKDPVLLNQIMTETAKRPVIAEVEKQLKAAKKKRTN
jgi:hypothetical protein